MKHNKCFVLVLILIAVVVCLSSCQKSDSQLYEEKEKTAEALMLQHKYAEAAKEMEELTGFQKADQFAGYCRGLEAGENGEFDKAAKLFSSLGDYRDSSKMFTYYNARAHETKADEGGPDQVDQYLSAAETFAEVESFRDSKERSEKCYQAVYTIAQAFAEQKQYEQAEKVYVQLDKYLDSASLAQKAKADALYEAGDLAAADEIYNKLDKQYQTYANDYQEKYDKATELKTQKQYDEAKEMFLSLGEYKDSPKQIQECIYLEAADLLDNSQYDDAAALFSELDYKDSSAMVMECSYRKAMNLASEQQYDEAAQILTSLSYYKDSKEQLERIKADELFDNGDLAGAWQIYSVLTENYWTHKKEYEDIFSAAGELRKQERFDEARKQYLVLGTYREADRLAIECMYDKAEQYELKHYYSEALAIYQSVGDQNRIDACHYQYGKFLLGKKQYKAAGNQFASCPDYRDSGEQRYLAGVQAFQEGELESALEILRDETTHEDTKGIIYEIAAAASQNQEYELAISAYDCIGDYQDARQERARNYMLWADQLFERDEYDQYIQVISALGDSDNTKEMIRKADYAKAKKLMESGAYERARAELQKLDGYEDSLSLLKDCEYELAVNMYSQGEYQEALAAFEREQMAGYRDADKIIRECRYQIGRMNETASDYQTAAELYELCGAYLDSQEHWLECCYRQAIVLKDRKEYSEAIRWLIKARTHINTNEKLDEIKAACENEGKEQEAEYAKQISFWIRAENELDNQAYGDAVSYYRQITDPSVMKNREKEACYFYGEELLQAREFGKAAEMFSVAADYQGAAERYMYSRLEEGNQALEAGDYEKARLCFNEAKDENRIREAWFAEAEHDATAGLYSKAREIYSEFGLDGKISEVWNLEGESNLAACKYAEAKEAFRTSGNQSRYEDAVLEEAKAYIAAEDYGTAYELLTEIQDREEVREILHTEKGFISYRINPGDTIVFGTYEQDGNEENGGEPIEWIVLAADDDNQALVISRYGLDCQPYNLKNAHVTWQKCTLRVWLNHDFYTNAFSEEEQKAILTKKVDNSLRQGNSAWNISGGEDTSDNIFLLSYQESEVYLSDTKDRLCVPTEYAIACGAHTKDASYDEPLLSCWWWLRSPGSSSTRAARVGTNGSRAEDEVKQGNVCVRPVLWMDLTAVNF